MPEQRRKAPMEAAVPKHTVEICESKAKAVTLPGREIGVLSSGENLHRSKDGRSRCDCSNFRTNPGGCRTNLAKSDQTGMKSGQIK